MKVDKMLGRHVENVLDVGIKDAEKALRSQTVGPRPGNGSKMCGSVAGTKTEPQKTERMSPQACVRATGAFGLVQDNYSSDLGNREALWPSQSTRPESKL
ncbi:hypothetical protein BS50DRAFT_82112 [Corynespora cassiicola Philippines]|uniref:Uncharacterized protein n=1 Tax=Corynespora cassiicola Philippines TaxID=1448308 RepID=A0A2T2MZH0_CORCC|nr:hypothetical protein BS50DRAFT_82112 [Corynespora cassiicola Philippines]